MTALWIILGCNIFSTLIIFFLLGRKWWIDKKEKKEPVVEAIIKNCNIVFNIIYDEKFKDPTYAFDFSIFEKSGWVFVTLYGKDQKDEGPIIFLDDEIWIFEDGMCYFTGMEQIVND
jgi:hypothetical protein